MISYQHINYRKPWFLNKEVAARFLVVILFVVTFVMVGYQVPVEKILLLWLIALAPLAVLILLRPFLGLLIFIALIPLESAFLGLGGGGLTITRLLGIYVFGAWILRIVIENRDIKIPTTAKWAIALMTWMAFSYFWAWDRGVALERIKTAVQLILLALLVINEVNSPRRLTIIIAVLFSACILTSSLGLFGIGIHSSDWLLTLKGQGAKEYASYTGIAFLLATIFIAFSKERFRILALIAASILLIPLFASGERGVILALALAWIAISFFRQHKQKTLFAVLLVLGVLYTTPLVLKHSGLVSGWIAERFYITSVFETGGSGRVGIWKVGLSMVSDNPLLGIGIGNFKPQFHHYIFSAKLARLPINSDAIDPHNDWLGVAGETGLVGLSLFIVLLVCAGRRLINTFRYHMIPQIRIQAIMVFGLFIYALSIGLASTYMWRKVYWLILALAVVIPELSVSDNSKRQPAEKLD